MCRSNEWRKTQQESNIEKAFLSALCTLYAAKAAASGVNSFSRLTQWVRQTNKFEKWLWLVAFRNIKMRWIEIQKSIHKICNAVACEKKEEKRSCRATRCAMRKNGSERCSEFLLWASSHNSFRYIGTDRMRMCACWWQKSIPAALPFATNKKRPKSDIWSSYQNYWAGGRVQCSRGATRPYCSYGKDRCASYIIHGCTRLLSVILKRQMCTDVSVCDRECLHTV